MTTGTNHIEIYCPKCGSSTDLYNNEFQLVPGLASWSCPVCKAEWQIEIGFCEMKGEGKNETQAKK